MPNRPRTNWATNLFAGLALVCSGAYLFISLQTYHPDGVPSWAPLISTTTTSSALAANLGGTLGALLAGYMLFCFGAAAYLLSATLIGYGLAKWFVPGYRLLDKAGWGILMVLVGACLFAIQPWLFQDWDEAIKIESPGGWFGLWLGKKALAPVVGQPAAVVLLCLVYLLSLVFAVSTHPVRDTRMAWKSFLGWIEARRVARLQRLDEERRVEEQRRVLQKKAEKLEKKLKRKGGPEIPQAPEKPEPVAPPPEPEIIDATAPAPPAKKPKLSDVMGNKADGGFKPGLSGVHLENYTLPGLDLLDEHDESGRAPLDRDELLTIQGLIIETLQQFGIKATPGTITKGPTITRYEVYPDIGVRVDKIVSLERDIARATRAERINILAPIPGKDTVGIEIANSKKVKVTLRELFEKDAWRESNFRLPLALGMDVYGNTIIGDLAKMPHCLVAGTTGSGKSVCINAIIASLLFRYSPEQLRFIMIDPKVVEMQVYNSLPHLITPVVTDPKKVLLALRWVVDEMELRYRIFAKVGLKNISAFNDRPLPKSQKELDEEKAAAEPQAMEPPGENGDEDPDEPDEPAPPIRVPRGEEIIVPDRMPFIVVIIDELADLMQTAPADVESAIARITQMARAAGIHMIVATQTPRADVVTGIIKANIPSRIAFQVASKIDSRVILDENGAEKLLGQGDMLYLPPGTSKFTRAQGVLVTEEEIHRIVDFVSKQAEPKFDAGIHEKLTNPILPEEEVSDEDEELVTKCLEIIRQENRASTSMLQRRLKLGYTRAARVMDILEQRGVVGPKDGAKDREILVDLNADSGY
ncbi:MAG: DNA translocase FtsK 4TM domain-containing protein [Terrimicrobiaceae bacterium]|nr:DNA translocase FtsK 4TM domain-containing protein [Terrimicrobiaceae bacterium]